MNRGVDDGEAPGNRQAVNGDHGRVRLEDFKAAADSPVPPPEQLAPPINYSIDVRWEFRFTTRMKADARPPPDKFDRNMKLSGLFYLIGTLGLVGFSVWALEGPGMQRQDKADHDFIQAQIDASKRESAGLTEDRVRTIVADGNKSIERSVQQQQRSIRQLQQSMKQLREDLRPLFAGHDRTPGPQNPQ
jgi:hypothetical protein